MSRLAILGAGDLGRRVCHELVQTARPREVRLFGRDEETVLRAANLARFSALQRGYPASVDHAVTDLRDADRTAEALAQFEPDVVFLAASLQSWWVVTTLPTAAAARLAPAHFGPWLPLHAAPVLWAMQAMQVLRNSGCDPVVVNAAYPDAVHPLLAAVGLAPDVGIGNVANNVPGLRAAAGDLLGVPPLEVDVRLVAHHYVSHRLSRTRDIDPATIHVSVARKGAELETGLSLADVVAPLSSGYRRVGGLPGQAMTAASAASVLEPLLDRRESLVHAPGPGGLPGGYPARIGADRSIAVALPPGLGLDEAVEINRRGQVCDGIEAIAEDGTVAFEASAMEIMRTELGYHCETMAVAEIEDRATELLERYARYSDRVR
jgi:hypothetical protein